MQKLLISMLVVVFVAGAQHAAMAAPDEKGSLSQEEKFQKRDANADGQLTVEEFQANKAGRKATKAKKRFIKLDTDGDGFVTPEEFKAAPGANKV